MITLDTSGVLALLNRGDRYYEQVQAAFLADRGPYLLSAGILGEVAYMIETTLGRTLLDLFLADLESDAYQVAYHNADWSRIRTLVARYADLPLGFADAAVIACAERHGGRGLTLDRRHFGVVAREGSITIAPA